MDLQIFSNSFLKKEQKCAATNCFKHSSKGTLNPKHRGKSSQWSSCHLRPRTYLTPLQLQQRVCVSSLILKYHRSSEKWMFSLIFKQKSKMLVLTGIPYLSSTTSCSQIRHQANRHIITHYYQHMLYPQILILSPFYLEMGDNIRMSVRVSLRLRLPVWRQTCVTSMSPFL